MSKRYASIWDQPYVDPQDRTYEPLDVICVTCEAKAGQACTTHRGIERDPHICRVRLAEVAHVYCPRRGCEAWYEEPCITTVGTWPTRGRITSHIHGTRRKAAWEALRRRERPAAPKRRW